MIIFSELSLTRKFTADNTVKKNQLHAVSRIQLRESSVKAHRSSLSAEFLRVGVLRGGTQRRAFALVPERKSENIKE